MKILKFWAKTTHDKDNYPNAYHPLICHLIDVAAVAQELWNAVLSTAMRNRIASAFGLADDVYAAGKLVAFVAGLHDLGKCSPPFALRGHNEKSNKQTINLLELYKDTNYYKEWAKPAKDAPHGYVTASTLPKILKDYFSFPPKFACDISKLIGGHHGIFPASINLNKLKSEDYRGNSHWTKARKKLTIALAKALGLQKEIDFNSNPKLKNAEIMIVAGLVSVADWIGSDAKFFPCEVKDLEKSDFDIDLKEYKQKSREQAGKALEKHGWILNKLNDNEASCENKIITGGDRFKELFPFIAKRRPLQDMAIEISGELNEPGIVIIEAPTGEGKTEAAMLLADAWNSHLKQTGYYFALPTQATSNQMFERVNKFLSKSFPNENIQNQLLHGHASLSAEFKTLKENYIKNINDDESSGNPHTPSVVAAEWFTYRKRGLLAPFGVGTVDQALLAVLQTKHVFVRLFGLAHKTIIVDEVHAYDAYMSTLLERLLEWLAALRSPVILLSATLPRDRKDALIRAYQKGIGVKQCSPQTASSEDQYPRISYAVNNSITVRRLETSTLNKRKLYLNSVEKDFVENLLSMLQNSVGCVAIICNTVKRAQDLFELLSRHEFFKGNASDGMPKLDLLHARFRYIDRERREKRSLLRFGKKGSKVSVIENGKEVEKSVERPNCAILISTQIIEQSLDLDFDVMITELAPIDLLLQRAGRLHRHKRNNRPKNFAHKPELWIIQPELDENRMLKPDGKHLPDFGHSGIIYDKHILLRTWLELEKEKSKEIEIPDDTETMIEAVYESRDYEGEDVVVKKFWKSTKEAYEDDKEEEKSEAKNRWIAMPNAPLPLYKLTGGEDEQLEEDSSGFHKQFRALTRLNADRLTLVCLYGKLERAFLDSDYKNQVDCKNVVLLKNLRKVERERINENIRSLLRNSLSVARKDLILEILASDETSPPDEWKKSPLLRSCRILWLEEASTVEVESFRICLHSKVGLKVSRI